MLVEKFKNSISCKYKGINFLEFLLSKEKDIDEFEYSYKK